jgi:uncharacterized protein (TIGR02246 family)
MNPDAKKYRVRATALLAALGGVLAGLVVFWTSGWGVRADEKVGVAPRPAPAAQAEEEKALRLAAEAFRKAFNAGDVQAIMARWAPDGEYVDEHGEEFRGRDAIAKMYASLFAHHQGLKIELTIDSIRFISQDTAIVKGTGHARPAAGGPATASRFTAVKVKRDGRWLTESVHESACPNDCNYENLRDLEWLVGTWTTEHDGATVELKFEWIANRNFLRGTQALKKGDSVLCTNLQIIGWDPTRGRVRSWDFDSDGGFGSELWARDGARWVLEAHGVRRDGHLTESVNRITPVDAGSFTWQSVRRRVNGVELPDSAVVKAVRASAKK